MMTLRKICQGILCFALAFFVFNSCKVNEGLVYSTLETKVVATEMDGTYVLRVQGKGASYKEAKENAVKRAVHDMIFKNLYKNFDDHKMVMSLVNNPSTEAKNSEFFEKFFAAKGDYTKYVCNIRQASPKFSTSTSTTAILDVAVRREDLKRMLQSNNIN